MGKINTEKGPRDGNPADQVCHALPSNAVTGVRPEIVRCSGFERRIVEIVLYRTQAGLQVPMLLLDIVRSYFCGIGSGTGSGCSGVGWASAGFSTFWTFF